MWAFAFNISVNRMNEWHLNASNIQPLIFCFPNVVFQTLVHTVFLGNSKCDAQICTWVCLPYKHMQISHALHHPRFKQDCANVLLSHVFNFIKQKVKSVFFFCHSDKYGLQSWYANAGKDFVLCHLFVVRVPSHSQITMETRGHLVSIVWKCLTQKTIGLVHQNASWDCFGWRYYWKDFRE